MLRFSRVTGALALAAFVLVAATSAASPNFPARIDFPPNPNTGAAWAAEGIFGQGHTFWAGDTTNGAVYKGDVRTGEGSILVPAAAQGAKSAFGLFVDKWNRLWVAGGSAPTGLTERHAFVYDADTGALIKDILLTTAPGFGIINDVVATRDAVYLTNTNNAANPQANVLFKVPLGQHGEIGTPVTIPVPFTGGNGIEVTETGKSLIVVSISESKYFKIDADTSGCKVVVPGECDEIVLDQPAPRGDGLILRGHTLYSVLNLPSSAVPGACGEIAKIELNDDLTTGAVVAHLNSDDPSDPLVNPATADLFGNNIYVVRRNGFPCTTPQPSPAVRWLSRVDKNGG
jgi:hypothetical protein